MIRTMCHRVEDAVISVEVYDGHIYGHSETFNWSDVVIRSTIGGSKMQP